VTSFLKSTGSAE